MRQFDDFQEIGFDKIWPQLWHLFSVFAMGLQVVQK